MSNLNQFSLEKSCYRLTLASLFVLAISIFTSVTLSALSHVLIGIPGLYFFLKFLRERPFKLPLSFLAQLGFALAIISSVLLNLDIIETPTWNIAKVKYQLFALTGVFAYYYTFKNYLTNKHKKVLLYTFFIMTSLATISGIIGLYTGWNPLRMQEACHPTRACGLYGMYMTYGYGISMFLMIVFGLYVRRGKEFKNLNLNSTFLVIIFAINFAGLYLSYSRGAWLAFVFSIPFFFFKENKRRFAMASFSTVLLLSSAFAFSNKVSDVFTQRSDSNMQRLSFFEAAYYAFSERPVLGLGYRNFEARVTELKKKYKVPFPNFAGHAHNNFLEILATTGFIGAFFFALFCISWLFESYRFHSISLPFALNFIISGTVQYTYGDGENLFLILNFWALTVLSFVAARNKLKKEAPPAELKTESSLDQARLAS
jgi:O-antigen ligase